MKKRTILLAVLCLLLLNVGLFAAPKIGEITYLDGTVSITRNGKVMTQKTLNIGDPIENYDLIRTGYNGIVEMEIVTPQRQRMNLNIEGNTALSVELSKLSNGGEQTSFDMVSGSIGLNVNSLTGKNDVQVRTRTAAMGVRGTVFRVSTAPTEDLLVTCNEGSVKCVDESGKSLYAKPGKVVEKYADNGKFSEENVTEADIEKYRQGWFQKRLELFKANASKAIQGFAVRFETAYEKLKAAYDDLMLKKDILQKWTDQDKEGLAPQSGDVMQEKAKIIGALFKVKGNLVLFERVYFRLLELEYYYSQGYGSGDVRPGQSIKQFFEKLNELKPEIDGYLARMKYALKLYALRNGGYFPVDAFGGFSDDKDFFGGDDFMKK
ncbi:MAG: FecR domain-containing protein [Spirochaetales bacterium]|nr:FecR domain-containing protein [Spirochaetales bacterium]